MKNKNVEKSPIATSPDRSLRTQALSLKRVTLSLVDPWEKNPRAIREEDFERLKQQIRDLGVYKPLICYEEKGRYVVLGGNMRIRALREMGAKEVDISIVTPRDEAQKIEYALSDNDRQGYYEEDKLSELLRPYVEEINLNEYKVDLGQALGLNSIMARFDGEARGPETEWKGMPDFESKNVEAHRILIVHFSDDEGIAKFAKLLGIEFSDKARYIWYPEIPPDSTKDIRVKSKADDES